MISITCTNCRKVLTMDDAFAGGVCRCQHCGLIQTVPARKRAEAPSAGKVPQAAGLDELAEAVASSGLAQRGLKAAPAAPPPPPRQERDERRKKMLPFVLVGAAALVVLLGIVLAIIFWPRGGGPPSKGGTGLTFSEQGPTFCGVPLRGQRVIYLLDRGNTVGDHFDALKHACYSSVEELGPDRQFQVILWDNGETGPAEYPRDALHNATSSEVDRLRRDFQ